MMDLDENELSRMMVFTRKVSSMLMKTFKAEAFNWSLQDGMAAGQTVPHLHLHIVLRYANDMPNPGDWYPKIAANTDEILDSAFRPKLAAGVMAGIVQRLREEARKEGIF